MTSNKSYVITVRPDEKLYLELQKWCTAEKRSMNKAVLIALEEMLRKSKK